MAQEAECLPSKQDPEFNPGVLHPLPPKKA
jgi:hypothetical protein